jgi:hypothetical protein
LKEKIKELLKFVLGFFAILKLFGTMGSLQCLEISFKQALIQAGAIGAGLIIGIIIATIRQCREE